MAIAIQLIFMFALLMSCQRNICVSEDSIEGDDSRFKIAVSLMKPNRLSKMLFDKGYHEQASEVLNGKNNQIASKTYQEKFSNRNFSNISVKPDTIGANQLHLNGTAVDDFLTNGGQNTEIIWKVQPKPINFETATGKINRKGAVLKNDKETIWEMIHRITPISHFAEGGIYSSRDINLRAKTINENNNDFKAFNWGINMIRNEATKTRSFGSNMYGHDHSSNKIYRNSIPARGIPDTLQPLTISPRYGIHSDKNNEEFWTSKRIAKAVKISIAAVGLAILGIYYCNKSIKKRSKPNHVPTREEALRAVPVYHV